MSRLPSHIKDEPHIRLWANYFDDAESEGLSLPTATAYLQMACRCRQMRSDGWIHEAQIAKLGISGWKRHVAALAAVDWLEGHQEPNGRTRWLLRGYLKWNLAEEDYARAKHNGRLGGCRSKHPQPCDRVECMESQAWLGEHPQPSVKPPLEVLV